MPDAVGHVDLTVNGTSVKFSGAGYHDSESHFMSRITILHARPANQRIENWGTQPFTSVVGSWYWGHGRLGPYSIVWFDALSPDGTESVSAYVSLDDRIVVAACSGIRVRPLCGVNYPPKAGDPPPVGFSIEIDLGAANGGLLVVNATSEVILQSNPSYYRAAGTLSGGFAGQKQLSGNALYEQFHLL